jgi:ABC-type Fe3+-hydroxamate transport system substrate-binding protein
MALDQVTLVGTIANAGTLSTEFAAPSNTADLLSGRDIIGISMPAAFTGTALTFQANDGSGTTFNTVTNAAGTTVSVTVAANRYVSLDPAALRGFASVKVVSSGTEGAERVIRLIARRFE